MNQSPKKIFVPTRSVHMVDKDLKYFATIPYVRADLVDDLVKAFGEVLRISDRDHDAWAKAKAALARVKEEG